MSKRPLFRLSLALGTLTLLLAGCGMQAPLSSAPTTGEAPTVPGQAIQGQYIVVLKQPLSGQLTAQGAGTAQEQRLAAQQLIAQSFGLNPQGLSVLQLYTSTLHGFAARLSPENLRVLQGDPRVSYVEQDALAQGSATTQSGATWGLDRIDQRTLPLNGAFTAHNSASGVTAFMIDSGVDVNHPEFGGRALWGKNFVGDGLDYDCHGHGTHTAGTVGSQTYGVAKGVKLVGVKVLNCNNNGPWSVIIAGIDWAASNRSGPAVANISITGSYSQAVNDAVSAAIRSGLTVVTAAGNNSANACNYSPASVGTALTIGNVDRYDARRSTSNYGSCVHLFAPGTNITSTAVGGGTRVMTGTSMAAPHVTGVAAQYLAAFPAATPAEVKAAILNGSTSNVLKSVGYGSPNRMLYGLLPGTDVTPAPTEPAPAPTEPAPAPTEPAPAPTPTDPVPAPTAPAPAPGSTTYTVYIPGMQVIPVPNAQGFAYSGGTLKGTLSGPAGTNFDLILQRAASTTSTSWTQVARSATSTSSESVSYVAPSGTYAYRWVVSAVTNVGGTATLVETR